MKTSDPLWRTVPRKTLVISLVGVFFIFGTIGFANDIIDMGRQPWLRFAVVEGIFPSLCRRDPTDEPAGSFAYKPAPTNPDERPRDRPLAEPVEPRRNCDNIFDNRGLRVLRLCLHSRGQTLFSGARGDGAGRRDSPRARPCHRYQRERF